MPKITTTQRKILASRVKEVMDARCERQDKEAERYNERIVAATEKALPKLIQKFLSKYASAATVDFRIDAHDCKNWYRKDYLPEKTSAFTCTVSLGKLDAAMEKWLYENGLRALGAPQFARIAHVQCFSLDVQGNVPENEEAKWREAFRKIDTVFLTGDAAAIMQVIDDLLGSL